MSTKMINRFLNSLFRLLGAQVERIERNGDRITGIISWEGEDDKQDFTWLLLSEEDIEQAIILCDYLLSNDLVKSDYVIVSESTLIDILRHSGYSLSKAQAMIDSLLAVEIKMVDEQLETDSFFLHFNN